VSQPKSHWDILKQHIEKGGHTKLQAQMIQRARRFTALAEPIEVDYPQVDIPVDTSLPSFTGLSHPNRQHIAGHLRSHKDLVENAVSRVDTQPPKALHWSVRKTVQRLRDPLPSLSIPNTLKNHMASTTLDHIKRQHHFHDDLINRVKSRINTHHTLHHVKVHMKKQRRRKKGIDQAKYQSQLRAQRKRRVTGTGAGTNRGWMLKSEKDRPMQLPSRRGKRDPRMMEEPFIGGLNHLARMNGLFHWPTKGSGVSVHIATLDVNETPHDEEVDEGDEEDSSVVSSSTCSREASSRESRDHFPGPHELEVEDHFPYRPISR
tara:strand:+ start:235 stop:1191 length:957 start_codon:yes stop_codon:yes gene_type:complete